MKILHLIETLAVEGGGGDRACLELAKAQHALGHDVEVYCFRDHNETPMRTTSVNIKRFDRCDRIGMRQAVTEACSTDCDIVHVHGAWRMLQTWARQICSKHNKPYVLQPHGLFSKERLAHKRFRKQLWFNLFERSNLKHAAAVVAESQRDRESLARLIETDRIVEIPCGGGLLGVTTQPDIIKKKYPELYNKAFLLFFGRLDYHKGIDILIETFAATPWLRNHHALAIVGPDFNGTLTKLRSQANHLNLSSVYFYDKVTEETEKAALFDAADAFVLPSRDENFGITVLEALSRSCPVLVSNATAWGNIEALEAGFTFNPDQKSLAAALQRYRETPNQDKERLKRNGLALAAGFDWSRIAETSITYYRMALSD